MSHERRDGQESPENRRDSETYDLSDLCEFAQGIMSLYYPPGDRREIQNVHWQTADGNYIHLIRSKTPDDQSDNYTLDYIPKNSPSLQHINISFCDNEASAFYDNTDREEYTFESESEGLLEIERVLRTHPHPEVCVPIRHKEEKVAFELLKTHYAIENIIGKEALDAYINNDIEGRIEDEDREALLDMLSATETLAIDVEPGDESAITEPVRISRQYADQVLVELRNHRTREWIEAARKPRPASDTTT